MEYLQVHDFGYIENNQEIFLLYVLVKNLFMQWDQLFYYALLIQTK